MSGSGSLVVIPCISRPGNVSIFATNESLNRPAKFDHLIRDARDDRQPKQVIAKPLQHVIERHEREYDYAGHQDNKDEAHAAPHVNLGIGRHSIDGELGSGFISIDGLVLGSMILKHPADITFINEIADTYPTNRKILMRPSNMESSTLGMG